MLGFHVFCPSPVALPAVVCWVVGCVVDGGWEGAGAEDVAGVYVVLGAVVVAGFGVTVLPIDDNGVPAFWYVGTLLPIAEIGVLACWSGVFVGVTAVFFVGSVFHWV